MILSVSRRSDIPAFYGNWFLDRLKKGTVVVANPFNPNTRRNISLKKEDVEAFVFWTRNPFPFFPCLDFIDKLGIPYYFLITLNDYPAYLEPMTPDRETAVSAVKKLYDRIGKGRIIWRYDPIILSSDTPIGFHKRNFSLIARLVSRFSFRVIISFLDWYPKVLRRFKQANLIVEDIRKFPEKYDETAEFLQIEAARHGLEIQSCAEDQMSAKHSLMNGKCIDDGLLNRKFGLVIPYKKDRHQRTRCLCQESVDIGTYGSCRFKCLYCYAS